VCVCKEVMCVFLYYGEVFRLGLGCVCVCVCVCLDFVDAITSAQTFRINVMRITLIKITQPITKC
jgi:hypothetical protein